MIGAGQVNQTSVQSFNSQIYGLIGGRWQFAIVREAITSYLLESYVFPRHFRFHGHSSRSQYVVNSSAYGNMPLPLHSSVERIIKMNMWILWDKDECSPNRIQGMIDT